MNKKRTVRHDHVMMVALRSEERAQVEQVATQEGLSMSAVIRYAILRDLRRRAQAAKREIHKG